MAKFIFNVGSYSGENSTAENPQYSVSHFVNAESISDIFVEKRVWSDKTVFVVTGERFHPDRSEPTQEDCISLGAFDDDVAVRNYLQEFFDLKYPEKLPTKIKKPVS